MSDEQPDASPGDPDPGSVSDPTPGEVADVAAQVAAYDESLGESVAAAGHRLAAVVKERDRLDEEVDELTERVQRVQADFENYKKRAERQQEEMKARATEDLVERLLEVRDNLARALEQDEDTDLRDGVEATLREFDRVLEEEGVERIDPGTGEPVDPRRHEVLHRESDDAETIASVFRPGYEMAEKVLRPAQVTVGVPEEDHTSTAEEEASESESDTAETVDDAT